MAVSVVGCGNGLQCLDPVPAGLTDPYEDAGGERDGEATGGFEGGQTPLYRRLPKLVGRPTGPGHQNEVFSLIKLEQLAGCDANAEVDFASLLAAGQVTKKKYDVVKVVGSAGDVSVPAGLTVKAHAFTGSARAAIEGAGGKCVELSKTTQEPVEA